MVQTSLEFYEDTSLLSRTCVILLSGRAGTGKSTTAKILNKLLVDKGYICVLKSFADEVKKVAVTCFGWNGKKDDRGRKLLQNIGNTGREYDKNIWVENTFNAIESKEFFPDFVIIDDWRFPNEEKYINDIGIYQTLKLRVESPNRESLLGTPNYDDISEVSLPSGNDIESMFYYDFVLYNSFDTLTGYESYLGNLVNDLFERLKKYE